MKVFRSANKRVADIVPLLVQGAVARTGNTDIPGAYCPERHVWMLDGEPLVSGDTELPELVTKTSAQLERDDVSPTFLLEMQTKTKAELERDDQVSPFAMSGPWAASAPSVQ